jgi:release factor H-coupled RctB family protein
MGTKIITSRKNWIESSAVEQLEKTAALPGMKLVVGMPDLHPSLGPTSQWCLH